jgi:hypothetical protein
MLGAALLGGAKKGAADEGIVARIQGSPVLVAERKHVRQDRDFRHD